MWLGVWSLLPILWLGLVSWPGAVAGDTVDPHVIIERMASAYTGIHDYTALFLKRERIKGIIQPLETIELRFQEPFKVYLAWRQPYAGRVITYVEGENDNKIRVNPGGILRLLRLSLDPSSKLAMRNSHHSIRRIGLANTIGLIMQQYQRGTQEGKITIHFRGHDEVDKRPAYHVELVSLADNTDGYYAYRSEIWIDKEYYLPTRLHIYDWDNQLYEHYEYHQLRLNPHLGREAFHIAPAAQKGPSEAMADKEGADG